MGVWGGGWIVGDGGDVVGGCRCGSWNVRVFVVLYVHAQISFVTHTHDNTRP